MSYKLIDILEELDGAGMIAVDEDTTIETLNDYFGINMYSDVVLTSEEVNTLTDVLSTLREYADDRGNNKIAELASDSLKILEGE